MPKVIDEPLNTVQPGSDWVLSRVATHEPDKLHYLGTLGLLPGTRFHLIECAPFNGPLQLRVNGATQVIGHELAGALRVCTEAQFELV